MEKVCNDHSPIIITRKAKSQCGTRARYKDIKMPLHLHQAWPPTWDRILIWQENIWTFAYQTIPLAHT